MVVFLQLCVNVDKESVVQEAVVRAGGQILPASLTDEGLKVSVQD